MTRDWPQLGGPVQRSGRRRRGAGGLGGVPAEKPRVRDGGRICDCHFAFSRRSSDSVSFWGSLIAFGKAAGTVAGQADQYGPSGSSPFNAALLARLGRVLAVAIRSRSNGPSC